MVLRSHAYSVLRRFLIYEGNILHIHTHIPSKLLLWVQFAAPFLVFFPFCFSTPCAIPWLRDQWVVSNHVTICLQLEEFATLRFSRSSLTNRKNTVFSVGVCTHVVPDVGVKSRFSSEHVFSTGGFVWQKKNSQHPVLSRLTSLECNWLYW